MWNMDIFQNLFRSFSGKKNELEMPVFAKKYVDKTEDLLALAARLDASPESMKHVYREAMEALGDRIKAHRSVHDILETCGLPIVILHDLHILSGPGAAAIDYVVLSNRYILAISCPASNELPVIERERKTEGSDIRIRLTPAENSTYIVSQLLRDNRLLNKKELKLIWPVTILPGSVGVELASGVRDPGMDLGDMNKEQIVSTEALSEFLKNMFKLDSSMTFISNEKVFSISKLLLEYEEDSSCSSEIK
jgi:hypothetical protein